MEKSQLLNTHFRFFPFKAKALAMRTTEEQISSDPILQELMGKKEFDVKDSTICFYLEDVMAWSGAWVEDQDNDRECTMVDMASGDKTFIDMKVDDFDKVMKQYIQEIRAIFWEN